MAKSKVGLKYAKIVRSSSGASAHSNARKGIVKGCDEQNSTCLSRKSRTTRKSMNVLPEMLNYASGFWAPKLSRKSASYDSEVSKSCSLENWGNFESIISANSSFSKDRKSTLLRGVNPPEILEETHTGIYIYT